MYKSSGSREHTNIEGPDWYFVDQYNPDGQVACPSCMSELITLTIEKPIDFLGSSMELQRPVFGPLELTIQCEKCNWADFYRGDEAENHLRLLKRTGCFDES